MAHPQVSCVLASKVPKKLAKFYSIAMGVESRQGLNNDYCSICHPDGMKIEFYRPSRDQKWPSRGSVLGICLSSEASFDPISEIRSWTAKLVSIGAEIIEKPRLESFGAESWISDPEGNHFLIYVPVKPIKI